MITIPILSTIVTTVLQTIETEYQATINPFGKAVLRAIGISDAGQLKLLYLTLGLLQKNVAPDTCDLPTLLRFGLIKLNRLPRQAIAAKYAISVTGTIGATIKVNTTFKSDDDSLNPGILYILDDAYILVSSPDTITVRALTAGLDGKLDINDTLTATAPMAQVAIAATVTSEAIQPLSAETEEDYRTAVVNAYRLESLGGAATDYRIWAADAQGVKKVYPYAKSGAPCEIDIYVEANTADSTDGRGTPSTQILSAVEAVINFDPDTTLPTNERGRLPAGMIPNCLPITPRVLVITITGFQGLTAQIQADLLSALNSSIDQVRPYVAAAEPEAEKNNVLDVNKLNGIIYTTKPGSVYTGITFTVDGVSYSTFSFMFGDIPYLNQTLIFN